MAYAAVPFVVLQCAASVGSPWLEGSADRSVLVSL
jgi:hypothetical protein